MTTIEELLELTDTVPLIKEKIEKCKSEKESFVAQRKVVEEEFRDQINVWDQLQGKCSATERELKHINPIGLGRIIGWAIAAIVAFLISQSSPPLSEVWVTWLIIASIFGIISITSIFLKNSRLKTRKKLEETLNRQKDELNNYEEKELSIFEEKCDPIDSEIERIDDELSQQENNGYYFR